MPNIFIALILLVAMAAAVVTLGFVISRTVRKRIDGQGGNETFTLSDLRRLHNQGQLTDAEFDRAKATTIAKQHAAMDREDFPLQGRPSTNAHNADAPPDND